MCGILDNNSYYSLSYDQRTYCTWPQFHLLCHDLSGNHYLLLSVSFICCRVVFTTVSHQVRIVVFT